MNYRVSLMIAAGLSLMASSALAAPVFMLQFGSFETREEAEGRLNELKGKHAGVLGRMQSGIREVTLPPDNLTVYRTQAGPLETRGDAQSVCSQLASNGDECYVVETAMMQQLTPPSTQVAQAAPAAPVVPAATEAPALAPAPAPAVAPAPIAAEAPVAGTSSVAPQAAPPVSMAPIPARDPENMATLARVSGGETARSAANAQVAQVAQATPPAPIMVPVTPASPELQTAMDKAVAEQNSALNEAPTPAGAKKEGTFWSRLNPFSDDEPAAPAKPAAPKAPELVAAPVEPVTTTAEAPMAELPVPAPVLAPEAPKPAPMALAAAPAPLVIDTPAPAPSMQLPPPPAPLNLADRAAFDAGKLPVAGTVPTVPAPMPVLSPESTGTLAATPAPVLATPQANGNVRVGEAQRVPLSEATLPPPAPTSFGAAAPAPAPVAMAVPAVSLKPSSTIGQKTLWAQIGTFDDTQAALGYWENYRRSHPDFPVVRVRVTSPYQAITRGLNHVSLRVGPFAKTESINNLCRTITQQDDTKLRCGQITDLGVSAGVGGPRRGYLPGSRYQR